MTKESKPKKPSREDELRKLGLEIQNIFDMGYVSKKRALSLSFLKGMATGAGAFVGGTLVVALVLWLLSLFDQVPLIGGVIDTVRGSLKK